MELVGDDNDGAALLLHLTGGQLRHEVEALQIGIHILVKVLLIHVNHLLGLSTQAGIVDQDVQMAEGLHSLGNQVLPSGGAGDVGGHAQGLTAGGLDLLGDCVALLLFPAGDDNRSAIGGHGAGNGIADAAGGASDDGHFTLQVISRKCESHSEPLLFKIKKFFLEKMIYENCPRSK